VASGEGVFGKKKKGGGPRQKATRNRSVPIATTMKKGHVKRGGEGAWEGGEVGLQDPSAKKGRMSSRDQKKNDQLTIYV